MKLQSLRKGRYAARLARGQDDVAAAQRLRGLVFRGAGDARDGDAFDAVCHHVLIEEARKGRLIGCYRLLPLCGGAEIGRSYAAQHYGLAGLESFPGPMVEIGRFCVHPEWRDPDILRVAWATMTRFVDATGVEMLFGCSSFRGTCSGDHIEAFTLLAERHLAPRRFLPAIKAPDVVRFVPSQSRRPAADAKRAMLAMPPLLRSYLAMGGWVGDHAVVDRDLGTLHVFTGLEIRKMPSTRKRLLRATAA